MSTNAQPTSPFLPLAIALGACLTGAARAGAGDLDPLFAGDGLVNTPVGAADDEGAGLALQPDRKIVVVGSTSNGTNLDFVVARYLPGGGLDPAFGTGGIVTTPIGASDDVASDVAIQADGKIVVVGYSTDAGGIQDFALVRYLASGALDPAFGTGGKVTTSWGDDAGIAAVALSSGGKIVVAGADKVSTFSPAVFALARYLGTGALDTSFSGDGKQTTLIASAANGAADVLVQPDGKVVAAGIAATFSASSFALTRYLDNGSLDGTFGSGGIVSTPVGAGFGGASSVVLLPDGKLVAGGGLDGSLSFILVRYTTGGAVDGTFGSSGQVTTPFAGPVTALWLDPDGKLVASGGNTDFLLARYLSGGGLDTSFSGDGKVTTVTGGPATVVLRTPEGEYLVSGSFDNGPNLDVALARYTGLSGPFAFCFGTDATCPCANGGDAGKGCDNTQATGGVALAATAYAPDGVGSGTATLVGTGFPAALEPAVVLIRSPLVESPQVAFGDGLRCIQVGGLVRLQAQLALGGTSSMDILHGGGAGSFHYQLWYRSAPITFCDALAAFNLSNALSIPWP